MNRHRRRRTLRRIWEGFGMALFVAVALAVAAYVALLLYDFFTTYSPPR